MIIYRLNEKNRSLIKDEIEAGAVFVYPTDTIYGIGCNALDSFAVKLIRKIKHRDEKPLSVIAPSKEWILENCVLEDEHKKYLDKLPGAYTLVLNLRNRKAIAPEVSKGTLGVRIPNHWVSDMVRELGFPVVTTSVNVAGKKPVTKIDGISKKVSKMIDFAIDEGELKNKPSKVIDLTGKKVVILR